jgi:hypothetical protein
MQCLRLSYCALALLFAATAAAQSKPGISLDQTIHTVATSASRTDSSTGELHMISAGTDVRIEIERGNLMLDTGPLPTGPRTVMIMHIGGGDMAFLNPDKKEYVSIKPFAMIEGMQKTLASMGGSMTVDTSATRISIDSLGPGPAIDGHPTLNYRLTMAIRMTMSMMGLSSVVDSRSTSEIQSATDLTGFADMNSGPNPFAEFSQGMGMTKDLSDKMAATRRKVRGFPLRSVKHSTTSVNGVTNDSAEIIETIETRNIKRVTVPDSVFAVPGDYKLITMPAGPGALP